MEDSKPNPKRKHKAAFSKDILSDFIPDNAQDVLGYLAGAVGNHQAEMEPSWQTVKDGTDEQIAEWAHKYGYKNSWAIWPPLPPITLPEEALAAYLQQAQDFYSIGFPDAIKAGVIVNPDGTCDRIHIEIPMTATKDHVIHVLDGIRHAIKKAERGGRKKGSRSKKKRREYEQIAKEYHKRPAGETRDAFCKRKGYSGWKLYRAIRYVQRR